MRDEVIKIEYLSKKYRLGTIGGGTLKDDIASWWARKRGKKDANTVAGQSVTRSTRGSFWALEDINLDVYQGDKLGIIGLNGAGKSTMLKILSRVTAPTKGRVTIQGSIASMLEVGTGFHNELTGRENIYLNGAILGMTRKEIDRKIEDIIAFSECGEFIDTPVKRYSSGMYVKLAFSVAAHLDANILVMDEVLAVGDMKFQEKCLGKMGSVADHDGKTVLYVSHNMNTIRKLCNRCIVLEHGHKIYDGTVEDAINIYANRDFLIKTHNVLETFHPNPVRRMEFLSLDVLHSKDCKYRYTDNYEFLLRFRSYEDVEGVHIRFILRWNDDTPVGMFISDEIALRADQEYNLRVLLPLQNLPDGSYYIRITASSVNSFGTHGDLGRCEKAAYFLVTDGGQRYYDLDWVNWGWGALLGKPVVMEQI